MAATKMKFTVEFVTSVGNPDDGIEKTSKLSWDSKTQQIEAEGVMFPWMMKLVLEVIEKVKHQT